MQIIDNNESAFPDRKGPCPQTDAERSLSRRFLLNCINDLLPRVASFKAHCTGARLELQYVPSESPASGFFSEDVLKGTNEGCRVFQVAVFALRDGLHTDTHSDSLVEYRLNIDPHAPLGLALGELLSPYLDRKTGKVDLQQRELTDENLLRQIAELVQKRRDISWDIFPSSTERWVTAKEVAPLATSEASETVEERARRERAITHITSNRPNAFLVRVLPSFDEFMRDRLRISTKFLSTYSTEQVSSVLLTTVYPGKGTVSLELQTRGKSGPLSACERFTICLNQRDPQNWLAELRNRVYNFAPTVDVAKQDIGAESQENLNRLLSEIVDPAMAFRERGPGGLRNVLSKAEALDLANETFANPVEAESGISVDQTILEGIVNLDANQLTNDVTLGGYSNRQSYYPNSGSYVHLEIGDTVACGSVMANPRDGSANVAWYLKNGTSFSSGDTSKLEHFWRALEELRSPSEGARYSAIEKLSQMCLPSPQGLSDPQDVLDFNVHSIPQVAFSPVKPVLPGQIARVVEGIEDLDATVMTKGFQRHFPQNFFMIRFSLHNDGALSIQAINSFKGRISAHLPAASFDDHKRSRSDTIQLLSNLLVSRPEGARQRIQRVITKLVDEDLGGWQSSVDNKLDAPQVCQDLPPSDAKKGNQAYDHAVRIARIFCETSNTVFAEIPIKLITKKGDFEPTICRVNLSEPRSATKLCVVVDHLGLKGVILRLGAVGRSVSEKDLLFVRRSNGDVPFRGAQSLRDLFTEYKLIGDAARSYLVGGPHPKVRIARLIDRLSSEMRLRGES